ncbi:MAG: Smr/MutS family endonuclease [Bacteroidetes bacterium]|nr:Smr/MutS family endonuclease [Bacteroidota bacterium]
MTTTYIYTIDIAHPPLVSHVAEQVLFEAVQMVRNSTYLRVIKVIHGIGSPDKPAVLKSVVQNWAYRNRHRIKACIAGEEYSLFNPIVQKMRAQCGQIHDIDLGMANAGITVLWIR